MKTEQRNNKANKKQGTKRTQPTAQSQTSRPQHHIANTSNTFRIAPESNNTRPNKCITGKNPETVHPTQKKQNRTSKPKMAKCQAIGTTRQTTSREEADDVKARGLHGVVGRSRQEAGGEQEDRGQT